MRYRRAPALVLAALVTVILVALLFADNGSSSPHSIRSTICSVFTGTRCGPAIRVAQCESRLNPFALGSAGERGLYQIHPVHFGWVDERRLWQPLYNARIAYRLSRGGRSWSHWTCRP